MKKSLFFFLVLFLIFSSCGSEGERLNMFNLEEDIKLGAQISAYIESDTSGLEILDSAEFPIPYHHLNRIKNEIINSGKLKHKKDFKWNAKIIKNDTIINAFATPGGYIYVYTGLIKYLNSEDQFAGVMAHEIAHADRRHSTAMLTKVYGISFLINIILGNDNQMISHITQNLLSLRFSRGAEEDADKHSVIYLCRDNSPYQADAAADFFEKMMEDKKSGFIPEFLSSHPDPPNRIINMRATALELDCKQKASASTAFHEFQKSLP